MNNMQKQLFIIFIFIDKAKINNIKKTRQVINNIPTSGHINSSTVS